MHSPLFGIKSLGFSLGPLMANNDVEASRISDVDRDLNSRQELKEDRKEFKKTRQSVGRDLPRTPVEEMEGYSHRRREFNKGSYNQHCLGSRTQHCKGNINEVRLKQQIHQGSRFDAVSSIITEEKLPTFNGSSLKLDFLDWFNMFEDYFEAVNPPDAVKCKLVASKLKGEARIWWKDLQNNRFSKSKNLISSWSRMRELLLKRFLHTSRLTYFYKQETEDNVKHTKCSTKFPNQLNKQEEVETIEYLQADGSIPPNCSTTGLLGVQRNSSLEENNVCEMVGDLCHNAEISRTEVSNKDNEYVEENNEGAKTIKHAEQEGADGIKNMHADKSMPAKYSIESPFESVNGKQPGISELEIHDTYSDNYALGGDDTTERSTLPQSNTEAMICDIQQGNGPQHLGVLDGYDDGGIAEHTFGDGKGPEIVEGLGEEALIIQLPKIEDRPLSELLGTEMVTYMVQTGDIEEKYYSKFVELELQHKENFMNNRHLPNGAFIMTKRFWEPIYVPNNRNSMLSYEEGSNIRTEESRRMTRVVVVLKFSLDDYTSTTCLNLGEGMILYHYGTGATSFLFDPGGSEVQSIRVYSKTDFNARTDYSHMLGVLRVNFGCFIFFFGVFLTTCKTSKMCDACNIWHIRGWNNYWMNDEEKENVALNDLVSNEEYASGEAPVVSNSEVLGRQFDVVSVLLVAHVENMDGYMIVANIGGASVKSEIDEYNCSLLINMQSLWHLKCCEKEVLQSSLLRHACEGQIANTKNVKGRDMLMEGLLKVDHAEKEPSNAVTKADEETSKAEEPGNLAIKRVLVMLMRYMPEEERQLLFFEENGFESAQRANELDAKLGAVHEECAKSAVEWCINRLRVGAVMNADELISVASKLVVSNKECELLIDECAKSAAELCIKKIRFGALVDKLDKMTILENEITETKKILKELMVSLRAFKMNVRFNKIGRALCDEEVLNINELEASSAFLKQSIRVLMEMTTTGVKFEENLYSVADKALALADEWAAVTFAKCVLKACVGVLVDKQSIFEVLKSEIAEAWKMEKEVKDSLVIYQRKQASAHHSQGSTTVVRGDERRRFLVDRFGLVWQKACLFAVGTVAIGIAAVVMGR